MKINIQSNFKTYRIFLLLLLSIIWSWSAYACDITKLNTVLDSISKGTECDSNTWPEDNYKGKFLIAYNYIKDKVGRVPNTDQGAHLTPDQVRDINDIPDDVDYDTWITVKNHLVLELKAFQSVNEWYADDGLLASLYSLVRAANNEKLDTFKTDYFSFLDENTKYLISVDEILEIASIAAELSGNEELVAPIAIFKVIHGITDNIMDKHGNHSSNDISTTVADAKDKLNSYFSVTATARENAGNHIKNDWGRLKTFYELTSKNLLVWPKNTATLRVVMNRSWQKYFMQQMLLATKYQLGGIIFPDLCDNAPLFQTDVYIYNDKDAGGCYKVSLGEMSGVPCPRHGDQPSREALFWVTKVTGKIYKKIFGTDTFDPSNPGLNMSYTDFFKKNVWKFETSYIPSWQLTCH